MDEIHKLNREELTRFVCSYCKCPTYKAYFKHTCLLSVVNTNHIIEWFFRDKNQNFDLIYRINALFCMALLFPLYDVDKDIKKLETTYHRDLDGLLLIIQDYRRWYIKKT